eukprot:m.198379 g.198379  ORF g.198379 m.198379 type:complete len:55 (-) comp13685_c3_seq28:1256-1420(-)
MEDRLISLPMKTHKNGRTKQDVHLSCLPGVHSPTSPCFAKKVCEKEEIHNEIVI